MTNGLERRTDGGIEGIGSDKPFFIAFDDDKYQIDEYHWDKATSLDELLAFLIEWIEKFLAPDHLSAVGHRMLHGGTLYDEPILVTPEVLENLRKLIPLAPLHQPRILTVIDTLGSPLPRPVPDRLLRYVFSQDEPLYRQALWLAPVADGQRPVAFRLPRPFFRIRQHGTETYRHARRHGTNHYRPSWKWCKHVCDDRRKKRRRTMGFSALDGLVGNPVRPARPGRHFVSSPAAKA